MVTENSVMKVSCWAQMHNLPDHLNFVLKECFSGVAYTSCCS